MTFSTLSVRFRAALVVLLTGVISAFAQYPAPVNFTAKVVTAPNSPAYVLLSWKNNPDADAPTKYNVYRAVGETEDESKFDKIGSVATDPAPREGVFTYKVQNLKAGTYTFFVKGAWADELGARTAIKVCVVEEPSKGEKKLFIVSTPVKTGAAGKTYEYKVKIEKNFEGAANFTLVEGPDGMTINAETGLIRWENAVEGRYEIVVEVSVEVDGEVIKVRQSYVLEIGKGEDDKPKACAAIAGQVSFDEPNSAAAHGWVIAWKMETVTKDNGETVTTYRPMYKAEIKGGVYVMEVPAGTYKFRVEGEQFDAEWYKDVYELADAEVVVIECNTRSAINFTVAARPEPTLVVVSGRMYDAETEGGLKGVIVFEARTKDDANSADSRFRRVAAETNADGMYEARLQAGVNYIAVGKVVGRDNNNVYLTEFWDNTNDATQASSLNLTANEDGVNFPMDKRPTYNNGFSGMMKNAHTGAGVRGVVIAYRLETRGKDNGDTVVQKEKAVTTETDANFGYSFANLTPGTYIVFGSPAERPNVPGWMVLGGTAATEWRDATRIVVGEVMLTVQYDINVDTAKGERGKGKVRGFVYDKRGGILHKVEEERTQNSAAILGSLVVARNQAGEIVDYAMSTNDGAYTLAELPVGTIAVTAGRIEYRSATEIVTVTSTSAEQQVSFGLVQDVSSVEVPVDMVGTSVNLFPNPTTNSAELRFTATTTTANVRFVSATGVVLTSQTTEVPVGATAITLNTAGIPSGMVMVHVTCGTTSFALPLQIVR